ncbi:MAG TPA: pilus assembly protein TadG-related protein [Xanthobacteraceae bacterium]|nr:pilus assembly protein TadG-related protein [Xanthobacteraceae bacterium]
MRAEPPHKVKNVSKRQRKFDEERFELLNNKIDGEMPFEIAINITEFQRQTLRGFHTCHSRSRLRVEPAFWVMAMATKSIAARLRNLIRNFAAARDGNIAILFALASIPVVGLMGAAVDYSRANAVKADLQSALDATALMVSKTAGSMTTEQLQSAAQSYFAALFKNPEAVSFNVVATYNSSGGSSVVLDGTASVPTDFMGILGISAMDVGSSATVRWGTSRLRVSLVLDVTGSMASANKMPTLKTAAKNLLTQLQGAASANGDVYVSIIPFNKDVNVGKSNFNQPWIRWDLWEESHGSCSKSKDKKIETKSACTSAGGTWTAADHNTWTGCVTDRDKDYDTTNTAPASTVPATLFPAEDYVFTWDNVDYNLCPAEMMGLTYDWAALKNKIDALQPVGATNQGIGLQWGFQSLTSSPFTVPAKDSNYKYTDVIILMSDGLNTQNRYSTSQTAIDAREQITCDNAKAAGIILYTIHVNTDGDPTSTLLKNCASSPDKFFLLTSANQMVSTFKSIGTDLTQLRLAK